LEEEQLLLPHPCHCLLSLTGGFSVFSFKAQKLKGLFELETGHENQIKTNKFLLEKY